MTKCIVAHCPNDSKDGTFKGPICSCCAEALEGERSPVSAQRIIASVLKGMPGWGGGRSWTKN